jgi:hypothetical protein
MKRRIAAVITALGLAAVMPLAASAGGSAPADSQYNNPITTTTSGVASGPSDNGNSGGVEGQQSAVGTANGSSLPFTGFDAALVLVGGLALVGLGVGLRRFGRRSSN